MLPHPVLQGDGSVETVPPASVLTVVGGLGLPKPTLDNIGRHLGSEGITLPTLKAVLAKAGVPEGTVGRVLEQVRLLQVGGGRDRGVHPIPQTRAPAATGTNP